MKAGLGEKRVAALVERIEAEARERMPGARVSREDGRVVIGGRGLRRRVLADAALRWAGGWLK